MPDHMQYSIRRIVDTGVCNKVLFHAILSKLMGSYDSSFVIPVMCKSWCNRKSITIQLCYDLHDNEPITIFNKFSMNRKQRETTFLYIIQESLDHY